MMPAHEPGFFATTLRIGTGVVVWAVHFAVVYGFTALACARGLEEIRFGGVGLVGWVVGAATATAAAIVVAAMVPAFRGGGSAQFIDWLRAGVAALALVAIAFEAAAVPMVRTCG